MKNKLIKLLPLLLLSSILISCNGLQWGKSFDDITDGIYQTVTYYNEDETVSVTRRYMIGTMQNFPDETDTELCTKFGMAGYIPSSWKLIEKDLTQEQIKQIIDNCGIVVIETEALSNFFRMSLFPISFKVISWITGPTTYTIQTWEENIEDDEYTLASETISDGVTETEVVHYPFIKVGFEPDQNEYRAVLAGDGSTLIKMMYRRKRVSLSVIDNSEDTYQVVWQKSGKYGAAVDSSDFVLPEKENFIADGWIAMTESEYEAYKAGEQVEGTRYKTLPETFDSESYYWFIDWKEKDKISWTAKYYTENIYDEEYSYVTDADTTHYGYAGDVITEALVKDSMKEFDDVIFVYDHVKLPSSPVLDDTGNKTVEVYLKRVRYTVTVDLNGGKWSDNSTETQFEIKYGSEIGKVLKTPELEGYVFKCWKNIVDNGLDSSYVIVTDQTIIADYKINTITVGNITVEFTKQTSPSSDFTITPTVTENSIKFEIDLPGTNNKYLWTVNGLDPGNESSYTLDLTSSLYPAGSYQIICIAVDEEGVQHVVIQDFNIIKKIDLSGAGA